MFYAHKNMPTEVLPLVEVRKQVFKFVEKQQIYCSIM